MTPTTLLALARAVYPKREPTIASLRFGSQVVGITADYNDMCSHSSVWMTADDVAYVEFDPATNPEQTLAVLCWLNTKTCIDWHTPDCNISGEHQIVLCDYDASFNHDNTPASLAAAIVKAAVAVIEAKENK